MKYYLLQYSQIQIQKIIKNQKIKMFLHRSTRHLKNVFLVDKKLNNPKPIPYFSKVSTKSLTYSFSTIQYTFDKNNIIPYIFGGLKHLNLQKNQQIHNIFVQGFGQNTIEGFKQAYKFLLLNLANKDTQQLKQICEANLLKKMNYNNIELIHVNQNVQAVINGITLVYGANITRDSEERLRFLKQKGKTKIYHNINFHAKHNDLHKTYKYLTQKGISSLIAVEVLFRSPMRLVSQKNTNKQNRKEQIHSVQFQIQVYIKQSELIKITLKSLLSGRGLHDNIFFIKELINMKKNEEYQWHITDIDRVLNGNFALEQKDKN